MSLFSLIRPEDDPLAIQASDWASELLNELSLAGHGLAKDLAGTTSVVKGNILSVLCSSTPLVCYFGHGDDQSFLTLSTPTVDSSSISVSTGTVIVAIACFTGKSLGPAAITAGADTYVGFTIKLPVILPYRTIDPIGEAIVAGLKHLGGGSDVQHAADMLRNELDKVSVEYDTGAYSAHPAANLGYFGSVAMRDHLVLHGDPYRCPL
jgi:hypothetical protein